MYKNGYVPPSGLLSKVNKKSISSFNRKYQNTPIRMGCVVEIHEIDSNKNISNTLVEYDVVTDQINNRGANFVTYQNCIAIDKIGGIGDFFEYKLRNSTEGDFEESHDFKKQNGSLVLLLCIDGFSEKGIIIGGVKHPKRKTNLTPDAGLHLEGEYNGLNWQVNKDGELTVTFKSKTDNNGEPQDKTSGGSFAKIDKDGSFEFDTTLKDADATSIKMDKPDKNIDLTAGNDISNKATSNINLEAGANISAKAEANISFDAGGSAKYSSSSAFDIDSGGSLTIKSKSTQITTNKCKISATDVQITSPRIILGAGGQPAIILTTKYLGFAGPIPVVSSPIGPFSTTVLISP